jgi:hypothetical protein
LAGLLTFRAASTPACSSSMVETPVIGAPALIEMR